ncbi:MAG: FAD-dependent oxidoreductase [Patescibacteria group bacterium]|nr:FAD-dependent oxidoreductase [Patescibacteria group bacterium]
MQIYDLIIIGSGPAGIACAIYAARYKMNFLIVGKMNGGTVNEAHRIENYPGFNSVPGVELAAKFKEHLKSFGQKIIETEIVSITKNNGNFLLKSSNEEWQAKNIILALGTERRKLEIPGEKEFVGKGVSYCATCDAFFYKNKKVAVIGGSDSAVTSALYLADLAEQVYLIYRRSELRAEPAWTEKLKEKKNIEVILERNLKEIKGDNKVQSIILKEDGKEISVDGVFIEAGSIPSVVLIKELNLQTDDKGYITVDSSQKASVEGVYAVGDISTGSNNLRQIITGAAEGAIAANAIYLKLKKS